MSGARVDVAKVSFRYEPEGEAVLAGLDLHVPAGSTTALLGPNGAGKSTLLFVLLGWRRPQEGTVEVDGRPVGHGPRAKGSVALVPQSEHVPFDFSLLEYVLLGRAPHLTPFEAPGPRDVAVALEALAAVGLEALAARPVPALSGGQKQLAMIARALAQEPRLLLLDEPFSHLDLGNVARVEGILRRLAAGGLTILFTTHDPNLALDLADRVAVLRGGRIAGLGAPREVLTAEMLAGTFGVPAEVVVVEGRPIVVSPRSPSSR